MLEQGPTEQSIIQQCVKSRLPLPDAIANAPELDLGLDLYFNAFMDLTTCRQLGMAEGPIPWTAIRHYCDEHDLDGEQRDDLFFHVRELDNVYLKFRSAKVKKANEPKPTRRTVRKK